MPPSHLEERLRNIGRQLNAWRARLVLSWGTAATLGVLFAAALLDLLLRFDRPGRLVGWLLWVAAAGCAAWRVIRELKFPRTVDGVAARIEATHPELDNRLINVLQFARTATPDAMVAHYVEAESPSAETLDPLRLKDTRAHRRALLTAGAGLLLLALPLSWHFQPWLNAVLRVVNPFSSRAPSTLAVVRAVHPGNTSVISGAPLILTAEVDGKPGHPVALELKPQDDAPSVHALGDITESGVAQKFAHDLPRVTTGFSYRFRAADARSDWYRVEVLPPLSVATCEAKASPPAHTAWEAGSCKPLMETVRLPEGTVVELRATFNHAPSSIEVRVGDTPHPLATGADGAHAGTFTLQPGKRAWLTGADAAGSRLEVELGFEVVPDAAPKIQVVAPAGRGSLRPGERPRVDFRVADDFGLAGVRIEQVDASAPDAASAAPARVLQEWAGENRREVTLSWSAAVAAAEGSPAFRVTAWDNAPAAHTNRSALIVFDRLDAEDPLAAERKAAAAAAATLSKLVETQRRNLSATTPLAADAGSRRDAWLAVASVQQEIRALAGTLLSAPGNPLGELGQVLRDLHAGAMAEAVDVLGRAAAAEGAARAPLASRGVMLEERILRVLTRVDANFESAARDREKSGLLALLDRLVKEQAAVMERTRAFDGLAAGPRGELVDRQDGLASDVAPFLSAARKEAEDLRKNDPAFSGVVDQVVKIIEAGQVSAEMLRAAEALEKPDPAAAMISQGKALTFLQQAQNLLNSWRAAETKKDMAEALEAVQEAKAKFEKLADMKAKVNEAQRELKKAKDLSDKEMETMQEEIDEMNARIEAAALQIATDLHIFPNLPVGNDLVEDVFTVYEEAKQVAGSEKEAASELGLQKEDWILDALAAKTERLDGMEMWLEAKPDATKRLTENFDQQEMPQIPVIAMPTEFEDIIGDLLEQQEEIEKETDDSATNQGSADMAEGWGIAEGEFTNFSAKGKSGNMRPDHNEQTGRSLVGREGQANGETAAGVGKINEGDKNIEARRTQDPAQSGQVQLDGHNDAKATGGGKLGGHDDEFGDSGAGPRRDAQERGSELGLQAQLRQRAEELYAKASMNHVRTGDLDEAVLNMRRAEEALRKGYPIRQVREWQRRAGAALRKTQAELDGTTLAGDSILLEEQPAGLDPAFASSPDDAPPEYRDLVGEYFKSLGDAAAPAAPAAP